MSELNRASQLIIELLKRAEQIGLIKMVSNVEKLENKDLESLAEIVATHVEEVIDKVIEAIY